VYWFVRNLPDCIDGGDEHLDRLHCVRSQTSSLLPPRTTRSELATLRRAPSTVWESGLRSHGRPLGRSKGPQRARRLAVADRICTDIAELDVGRG